MSEDKHADDADEKDPERTLITLEQLSQTIEVMTNVVNRLRQHLSEQLKGQSKDPAAELPAEVTPVTEAVQPVNSESAVQKNEKRESFVVEIRQQEQEIDSNSDKVLH